MDCDPGFAPPVWYEKLREVGEICRFGFVAGAVTVVVSMVVPVPPLEPSIAAPYIVCVVFAVTVGAVQLNVQLCVLFAVVWVISPPITWVVLPAVNVPPVEATSKQPLPPPLTVNV
jgi:hypothetical protein